MVKKNNSSDLVTKAFLEAHLELKLDELKIEIDENAKKYRDDILNRLDPVITEIENARLDRARS